MKVLIIEDEPLASERLLNLILEAEPAFEIMGILESVRNTLKWFEKNSPPDLIFMDVQLADGLCFEIFEKLKIEIPVIFTTAYNEYALKAFKVNSIDYLLKPISTEDLENALTKFRKLNNSGNLHTVIDQTVLRKVLQMIQKPFKTRFVVRIGEHIKAINCDDIAFFYSSDKNTFIRTINNRDFGIDGSLDQLETDIDPVKFFRVNRKQLISMDSIKDIISYSGSRLKIILKGNENEEFIVSREKVTDFKIWLEGN